MNGFESWTIKKAECWRIHAFKLWCWRRLLRVPWTARRSNQLILKEIYPEYSLEELMLKLKFQYFGYLMARADSLEKTLMLGKTEGRRRGGNRGWDGWMTLHIHMAFTYWLSSFIRSRILHIASFMQSFSCYYLCFETWANAWLSFFPYCFYNVLSLA